MVRRYSSVQLLTREEKSSPCPVNDQRVLHMSQVTCNRKLSLVEQINRSASIYGKVGVRTLLLLTADVGCDLRKGITYFFYL